VAPGRAPDEAVRAAVGGGGTVTGTVATMQAATVVAPVRVECVEAEPPRPGPGEVLVHVEGCGVCGSSLPLWEGRPWFDYPLAPGAPGHEVWGRLDDGRRVVALCFHGYAQLDVAPADTIVELPEELDGVPFPGEALGCAVNVVRRANVRSDEAVAVVGMGFLGTTVARLLGSVAEVRRENQSRGEFDVVIEAAGTQGALDTASALVAPGGRLVVAGFHQDGPRTVDLQSWNWRGIDVVNAHERDRQVVVEGMREAVRLAAEGALDVASLVTHRVALPELARAFELARTRPAGFLKAVVCP
jgi:threonine dehydrogenase-like Zn-dependent dehydrogenase